MEGRAPRAKGGRGQAGTVAGDGALSTLARLPLWTPRMTDVPLAPEECTSMAEVRAGVDATDAELVALLVRRFGYMRAAARIKPDRGAVRDEPRKAAVIANARAAAEAAGLPGERIAALWNELVEQSIAYELDIWDATRR